MDFSGLHEQWDELKTKIKDANADLSDHDLHLEAGNEEAFFGNLQEKLGKTRDEVEEWVKSHI